MTAVYRLLFILCFSFLCSNLYASPQVIDQHSVRQTLPLNGNWHLSVNGFDADILIPTSIPFYGGVSTWTKQIELNLSQAPAVAFVEFKGIAGSAIVKMNGVEVGVLHPFTERRIDVAGAIDHQGPNELVVEIDDRLNIDTVPGADLDNLILVHGPIAHTFPFAWAADTGIIRDVNFVYSDEPVVTALLINQTVNDDLTRADLNVRIDIDYPVQINAYATVGILDEDGSLAGSCWHYGIHDSNFDCDIAIENPGLWSTDNPRLYDVVVFLYTLDGEVDAVYDRTGIKKTEIRGNAFYLNNERVFLRGVTRHDEYGQTGFVVNPVLLEKDINLIKASGANFVRTIHYPPDEAFLRRADEVGLLVSEEVPTWAHMDRAVPQQIAQEMVKSMVERDMNHPSVLFWVMGTANDMNEAEAYFPGAKQVARSMDLHRPISIQFDPGPFQVDEQLEYIDRAEAAGMDFFMQSYYWQFSNLDNTLQNLPDDFPVVASEWSGSEGSNRGPLTEPGGIAFFDFADPIGTGDFPEEYQALTMFQVNLGWFDHFVAVETENDPLPVAGLIYFNWNDITWTGIDFFYSGHEQKLRSGLVYEDREIKQLPFEMFKLFTSLMPQ